MGSYRFEQAPSNRSSCTNKECKDAKVKILKGELRLGSWIEGERFQGYTWRHWGCTTPKVIENIVTAWKEILPSEEPDYTALDGYDELPEDLQLKVRTALTQGHVDDSDWKGDPEVNRPGKTGFRVRGGAKAKNGKEEKKAATTEGSDAKDDTVPAEKAKPNPKKAARGKKASPNEDSEASGTEETEQKPAANTKKPRVKKPATAADADAPPKKRGHPAKAAATETPAQPAKKGTKRKTSEEEAEDSEPEKPKRARGKASKTSALPKNDETAPPTKATRGRKKAPKE